MNVRDISSYKKVCSYEIKKLFEIPEKPFNLSIHHKNSFTFRNQHDRISRNRYIFVKNGFFELYDLTPLYSLNC